MTYVKKYMTYVKICEITCHFPEMELENGISTVFGFEVAPEFQQCIMIERLIYKLEESNFDATVRSFQELNINDDFYKDYVYRVLAAANECYIFKTELYGRLWFALGWQQKYIIPNDFELYIARKSNNTELLEKFECDPLQPLETYTHKNLPPIFMAILANDVAEIQRLIADNQYVLQCDIILKADCISVLDFCALLGNFLLFRFFVDKGCQIFGSTVECAIRCGNLNIITYLIEKGFSVENYFDIALEFHQTRLAELLIRRIPDENAIINSLKAAVRGFNTAGLYIFKFFGIEFDKIQSSSSLILHHATFWGNIVLTKYLIEKAGAYVNRIGLGGLSTFHYAIRGGNFELIKYLVAQGADINMRSGFGVLVERKFQPWQTEEETYEIKFKTPVPFVINYDFDPDSRSQTKESYSNHGKTPLILAMLESNLWLCEYLLDIGADRTIKDNRGHDFDYYKDRFDQSLNQFEEEEYDIAIEFDDEI